MFDRKLKSPPVSLRSLSYGTGRCFWPLDHLKPENKQRLRFTLMIEEKLWHLLGETLPAGNALKRANLLDNTIRSIER